MKPEPELNAPETDARIGRVERVKPLKALYREAALEAMEAAGNDIGLAAKLLGVGRTTLYRKLKKWKQGSP